MDLDNTSHLQPFLPLISSFLFPLIFSASFCKLFLHRPDLLIYEEFHKISTISLDKGLMDIFHFYPILSNDSRKVVPRTSYLYLESKSFGVICQFGFAFSYIEREAAFEQLLSR